MKSQAQIWKSFASSFEIVIPPPFGATGVVSSKSTEQDEDFPFRVLKYSMESEL